MVISTTEPDKVVSTNRHSLTGSLSLDETWLEALGGRHGSDLYEISWFEPGRHCHETVLMSCVSRRKGSASYLTAQVLHVKPSN